MVSRPLDGNWGRCDIAFPRDSSARIRDQSGPRACFFSDSPGLLAPFGRSLASHSQRSSGQDVPTFRDPLRINLQGNSRTRQLLEVVSFATDLSAADTPGGIHSFKCPFRCMDVVGSRQPVVGGDPCGCCIGHDDPRAFWSGLPCSIPIRSPPFSSLAFHSLESSRHKKTPLKPGVLDEIGVVYKEDPRALWRSSPGLARSPVQWHSRH